MIDLAKIISRIEQLLSDDTIASTTYAALEARLALEVICYDRLKFCHDYISSDDLKKWQPRDVIDVLIREVDENIGKTLTLSISLHSFEVGKAATSELEDLDYTPIGTQVGFDPKKVGSLWHALSRLALHVHIPENSSSSISLYGDKSKIETKVLETLEEFKRLSKGNMAINFDLGPDISFNCACGQLNKRRERALSQGKILSCINPKCEETYTVEINNDKYEFVLRQIRIKCKCGQQEMLPEKPILNMRKDQHCVFTCKTCGNSVYLLWRLMQSQK